MNIAELIAELEAIRAAHGNIECRHDLHTPIRRVEARPLFKVQPRDNGAVSIEQAIVAYLSVEAYGPAIRPSGLGFAGLASLYAPRVNSRDGRRFDPQ